MNKNDTACRLTHKPSGIAVEAQVHRSLIQNQKEAMKKLRQKLFEIKFNQQMSQLKQSRKSQVGNMDRNEKIRTYNYNRNQITDHRIGESKIVQNLNQFFSGNADFGVLDGFYDSLDAKNKQETVEAILKNDP